MRELVYGSVCSGIEAASVAWHPLGWRAAFLSEIEPFPRAVLAHHYPTVPLHGDFTTIQSGDYADINVLVGGTPCQSFSVAGLRGGLADERGNLALEYLRLADRLRPKWLVWENVPGVLSSSGGRDFGAFLGGLAELGYGWAYRVLDAQFFGVAQRRRRVFVVGHVGDWRRAAAVLFERHSLSGHPAPRRETREVAPTIPARSSSGGGLGTDFDCDGGLIQAPAFPQEVAATLDASFGRLQGASGQDANHGHSFLVPVSFQPGNLSRGAGAAPSHEVFPTLKSDHGRGASDQSPCVAIAFDAAQITSRANRTRAEPGLPVSTLAKGSAMHVAFDLRGREGGAMPEGPHDTANIRAASGGSSRSYVAGAMAVRRLTPRECERLQGFPDDYTLIPHRGKPAADGPRYKALGNSMAVPVMAWIGRRIQVVEELGIKQAEAA